MSELCVIYVIKHQQINKLKFGIQLFLYGRSIPAIFVIYII